MTNEKQDVLEVAETDWTEEKYQSTNPEAEALQTARLAWLVKHNPEVAANIRTLVRPDGSLVINDLTQTENDLTSAGVPLLEEELVDVPAELNAQPESDTVPDSAFGDMMAVETNATDLSVRVMCWNLSSNNVMGGRTLVNIESDDEARDILKAENIGFSEADADGWFAAGMAFENDGHRVNTTRLEDKNLRLLAIRALHVKFMRWDPPVAPLLHKYFAMAKAEMERQQAEQPKH